MAEHKCYTDIAETGFGFGQLDYFCPICQRIVKSVSMVDLNSEERKAVARYGVMVAAALEARSGEKGS